MSLQPNKQFLNNLNIFVIIYILLAQDCKRMDFIEEFIDFLIGASEQTRQHVDAVIKEAIACAVKV